MQFPRNLQSNATSDTKRRLQVCYAASRLKYFVEKSIIIESQTDERNLHRNFSNRNALHAAGLTALNNVLLSEHPEPKNCMIEKSLPVLRLEHL